METMRIYFVDVVSFENIKQCLDFTDYEIVIFHNPTVEEEQLIINFEFNNNPDYIRFSKIEEGIQVFDEFNTKRINELNSDLNTFFSIRFRFYTMPQIAQIFTVILKCYDGIVDCEGHFFKYDNIAEMLDLKLPYESESRFE